MASSEDIACKLPLLDVSKKRLESLRPISVRTTSKLPICVRSPEKIEDFEPG